MMINDNICTDCIFKMTDSDQSYCGHNPHHRLYITEIGLCKCNKYKGYIKSSQTAKYDAEKPRISLVPPEIIRQIAQVREYGTAKYGSAQNWRKVEAERYFDALLRHVLACFGDLGARDEESGLLHLSHAACNLAFILEMIGGENEGNGCKDSRQLAGRKRCLHDNDK